MTPIAKGVIWAAVLGTIGTGFWFENHQTNHIDAQIKQNELALQNIKHNKSQTIQKSKTVVKHLPNVYQKIKSAAYQVINAEYQIAKSNVNKHSQAYIEAYSTVRDYVSTNGGSYNAIENQWVIPGWKLTPVYGSIGTDGTYPVSFYITDKRGNDMGVITSQYQGGKFMNITAYYTKVGQKLAANYVASIKAKLDKGHKQQTY